MREPNKQKTISIVEVRSPRRPPAKHVDLLSQDQDFRLQPCSRLEERSQDTENQLEQIDHQAVNLPRPLPASMPNLIFGTHRERPQFLGPGLLPTANASPRVYVCEQKNSAQENELRAGMWVCHRNCPEDRRNANAEFKSDKFFKLSSGQPNHFGLSVTQASAKTVESTWSSYLQFGKDKSSCR
jgi:hypothetical protein